MSNPWEGPNHKGAHTSSGAGAPSTFAGLRGVKNQQVGLKLGAAFSILVAILIGIAILGLSRMDQINAHLEDVLGRRWTNLQLAREALMYSNQNSRITLEIFLLNDRRLIEPLLATRAENTNKISQLLVKLESQCDSEDERRFLAAVSEARAPYVASYLRALHLLIDENQQEAARGIMVQETTPALHRYHDAWSKFMQLQMEQVDKAANEGRAHYRRTRAIVLLLVVLAVIVAVAIAFFVTLKMTEEMQTRILAEREVRELNAELERRVEQRTQELAQSNQRLTAEIVERKSAEDRLRLQAAALEAAANSIVITDVTGTILWVNSAFSRLTGYRAEEIHGQNPRLLKSGKHDSSFYASLWKTITSGEVWRGEVTNQRKDGSLYDEEVTITPVRAESGEISHFVAIMQDITARKAIAEALLHAQEKYRAMVEDAVVGIFQATPDGCILSANPAMARMHGYDSPEQFMSEVSDAGRQVFVNPAQLQELSRMLEENGVAHDVEVEVYRRDGTKMWVQGNMRAVRGPDGKAMRHEGTVQDITDRKAIAEALLRAEEKYRAMVEDAVVGIYRTTPDGKFLSVNRALAQMAGFDSVQDFLSRVTNARQIYADPKHRDEFRRLIAAHGEVRDFEIEVRPRNGKKRTLSLSGRAARDPNGVDLYYEGIVQDITERKAAEQQVQFLAYYDALTGLPNRALFQDRLTKALAGARRRREKVALLFLDLDRFKNINDSLGHSAGDLLLKQAAERLRKWAREQDTVARLGGDEFVVVLTGLQDVGDAAVAADRIMKAMTVEFVVQGRSLNVTCSLGISVFPDHGTDGETLVKNADAAMYSAKEQGANNFQFFTRDMNIRAVERLTLENSLRLALEKKELFLVYQPQVDLATGTITGAEALLRWRHPELGLVSPAKFIPIAENSGLIIPIGEWVLRTACSQARRWQDEGLPAIPVAVNVSAVQFRQERFPQVVSKVLDETGLPPQYLELELTEGLLLSNGELTLSVLQELKKMGLKLSIDDFGTGYSSLSYLKHFPVYKLKIDHSFVKTMTVDPDDAAITSTIILMGKSLNLKVVAEGVENEEQMSFLRAHNCDEVQGYYFSRPLAADDFSEKVRSLLLQSDLQAATAAKGVLGRRGKLQLARRALAYSSRNSRITMEVFLLHDKQLIDPLLKTRAENTQKISELLATIESECDSPEEKQLLAAVKDARTPYKASYLRALHLLVDENQQETARAVMVQETTPALFKYHDAWTDFIQFQTDQMDKLRETREYESVRDSLTGLFNRRHMEESLERELLRSARNGKPVAVLMIDIDHFKRFNDSFGHEAGDILLRELASLFSSQIRGGDIACRYGGEEFLVIMMDASLRCACERAESLREQARNLQIHHRGETLCKVTISIGVAAFPDHGGSALEIINWADKALYKAKTSGRDRVTVAQAGEPEKEAAREEFYQSESAT